MLLTLKDAKNSRISSVLGVCKDSSEFKSYVNEAIERLMVRGDWPGTYERIRLCLTEGCITFPRAVEAIRELAVCGKAIQPRNAWYEFLYDGEGIVDSSRTSCAGVQFIYRGIYPTFADMSGHNYLRIYYTQASDINKKVLIFGYDANNQWIRSTYNGAQIDGFYMYLTNPFTDSPFTLSSITGVQKDETDGDVLLYEVIASTGAQRQLGVYQPSETVAGYQRYFLSGLGTTDTGTPTCNTIKTITAMAKLRHLPAVADSDYLYISNIPAIKDMAMSIRLSESDSAQNEAQALMLEKKAVREMNHHKQNVEGEGTAAIGMNVYGSAKLERQRIGLLI